MKGVSTVIILVLMLLITISLTLSLYLWATGALSNLSSSATQEKNYQRSRSCLNIEYFAASDNYVAIKNCGLTPLTDFKLYVDGEELPAMVPDKLDPQEEGGLQANALIPSGSHQILVTADLAESAVITVTK
jgi:hypothetical protein